jgi:hypothetical protein
MTDAALARLRHRLVEALDRALAQPLSEAEALAYFTAANMPKPRRGETLREAILRGWMTDIADARQLIPRLNPVSARHALALIAGGVRAPGAILKASHDQASLKAHPVEGSA